MRHVQDSFLYYLHTNLPSLVVNPVREQTNNPESGYLKLNAINVTYHDIRPEIGNSSVQVVIDVLNDNSDDTLAAIQQVYNLLKPCITPISNYTVPSAPILTGNNIFWDRTKIRFSRIVSDNYCHYSCVLSLRYADSN
jgi:hypothetical protein